jgi:hypothetical protein
MHVYGKAHDASKRLTPAPFVAVLNSAKPFNPFRNPALGARLAIGRGDDGATSEARSDNESTP